MNGMNGLSPEVMRRFVRDHQEELLRDAAAERSVRGTPRHVSGLRLHAGRTLVRVGQVIAGPAALPARERRSRIRPAKADGC